MTPSQLEHRKEVLLNLLEIGAYEKRLIRELSGGQQRRVCAAKLMIIVHILEYLLSLQSITPRCRLRWHCCMSPSF